MAHHAYYVIAESVSGIAQGEAFAETLGVQGASNPDLIVLTYGLFSVDDARALADIAYRAPLAGERKVLIVSVTRLFHEAQNALLKLLEEPPAQATIILVLPAEGILLPTLRSRLLPLPGARGTSTSITPAARTFLSASHAEREKIIAKLLDRSKSDKDEEKQAARAEAIALVEGCAIAARTLGQKGTGDTDRRSFEEDVHTFLPILHERSAPLKLIFEHLLLVIPDGLTAGSV